MAALAFVKIQTEYVIVDAEQIGHLTDQLILHPLYGKAIRLRVKLHQYIQEERLEVHPGLGIVRMPRPDAVSGLAQHGHTLDLMPAQTAIEDVRNRGQEVADGILHTADVRLLHGVAIRRQALGQLGLGQGAAVLLLIELARFLHAQSAFDEGQATTQFVFSQVSGQGDDFATFGPRAELAGDAEEPLLLGLAPQLAQDRQPGVAAVADDEVLFARAAGDRWRRIQTSLADGRLDLIVGRVALDPRVMVIGAQLIERHDHRRVSDRIAQCGRRWPRALKACGQQLAGHLVGCHFGHRWPPLAWVGEPCASRLARRNCALAFRLAR